MEPFLQLGGLICLAIRFWLVERKCSPVLGVDKYHISRIINYFFFLAMTLGFQMNIFTFLSVTVLPGMIGAFIFFDVPYLVKDVHRVIHEKDGGWQVFERMTLHLPLMIYGFHFYFTALKVFYFALFQTHYIISGITLVFGLFFLLDPRWAMKKDPPRGNIILISLVLATIGNIIAYYIMAGTVTYIEKPFQF